MYVKSFIVLVSLSAVLLAANQDKMSGVGTPGIATFHTYDVNGNGYLDKKEFTQMRKARQAKHAKEGRMMRNAATAPSFESIDTNGDKKLSKTEFGAYFQNRRR